MSGGEAARGEVVRRAGEGEALRAGEAPPLPRVALDAVPPYREGRGYVGMIKLSSNEAPFAVPRYVRRAIARAAGGANRYPPRGGGEVTRLLGRRFGVREECVTLGNGSDELMGLIALAYVGRGDEVIIPRHTFSVYSHVTACMGGTPVYVEMTKDEGGSDEMTKDEARSAKAGRGTGMGRGVVVDVERVLALVSPRTRVVFIATPNNPSGGYLSAQEVRSLCRRMPPRVLVVLDHAYADFCVANDFGAGEAMIAQDVDSVAASSEAVLETPTEAPSEALPDTPPAVSAVASRVASVSPSRYPNVVTLRTFSKLYGLAGLRIGYAISHPLVAAQLNRMRMPFSVNRCALAAAEAALKRERYFARRRDIIVSERDALWRRIAALGYKPLPAHGNFICLPVSRDGAGREQERDGARQEGEGAGREQERDGERLARLFQRHRIVIRTLHSFGLPNHIRITVGTARMNARVLRVLARWGRQADASHQAGANRRDTGGDR